MKKIFFAVFLGLFILTFKAGAQDQSASQSADEINSQDNEQAVSDESSQAVSPEQTQSEQDEQAEQSGNEVQSEKQEPGISMDTEAVPETNSITPSEPQNQETGESSSVNSSNNSNSSSGESRASKMTEALQKASVAQEGDQGTVAPENASPESVGSQSALLRVHGKLSSELGYHIYEPRYLTKFKNQAFLEGSGELSESWRYRISGRTYYDSVYDIHNHYSDSAQSDQQAEFQLRDAYLDYSHESWDLRLGKQQVVWGEAVGIFMADVVNAKDLREFILPDFDMIRIPEWGADIEYGHENFHSEFVFIPALEFNKLGVTGSEFASQLPVLPGFSFTTHDPREPKDSFEHSKIGGRLSYLLNSIDLGVFYLHSWTESPVLFRTINGGVYEFDPQYKRLDTLGATFSTEIEDVVYKGELVYNHNDYFIDLNPLDSDGIARASHLDYLLGADHVFFDKWDVNFQFLQSLIFDYKSTMFGRSRVNNSISLRFGRDFLNQKLSIEFLSLVGLQGADFMYRPSIKYNINDNWQVKFGLDVFAGDPNGFFGQYKNQSRYTLQTSWKF